MRIDEFFENLGSRLDELFSSKRVDPCGKEAFIKKLRRGLSGLPKAEADEHIAFYSEMIDDRMEEGLSEEEAVKAVGNVDDIISQILANTPAAKKEKRTKPLGMGAVLLLVLGSPVWFSLLVAAFCVVLSLWVCMWAVVISLWAVPIALIACLPAALVAALFIPSVAGPVTLAVVGAGLVCAGLAIIMFFVCKAFTKVCALASVGLGRGMKSIFGGRSKRK